jgi:hypothetical protein
VLFESDQKDGRRFVFLEYTGGAVADCYAVRSDQYKYLVQGEQAAVYDLYTDPQEQRPLPVAQLGKEMDVYLQYAEMCRKLKQ